ncbi:MAG TPA: hypothetical protein VKC53_00975 [Patescibacteria group bacterium]|nr:hypothetical protein [Patescibacteria group bacterium]
MLHEFSRFLKDPVGVGLGVRMAPIDSELAKEDFKDLLSSSKRLVRYAVEKIEDTQPLFDLIDRGVKLELIVGKSQDRVLMSELDKKGASVWRIKQGLRSIPSPFL